MHQRPYRDSNFHENITYNRVNPEETEKVRLAVKNMVKRALDMDGTCTGEHGIGIGKKESLRQEVGDTTLMLMVSFLTRCSFEARHITWAYWVIRWFELTLHVDRKSSKELLIHIG